MRDPGSLSRAELKRIFSKGEAEAPLARYFTRHVSYPITRLLLPTGVTPNQVTLASTVVFLAGAAAQLDQSRRWVPITGAAVMWLGLVLDTVDGEIARFRKQFSVKGGYVDMVSHRIINVTLFASAGIGLWLRDGVAWPLLLAMGAMFGELTFTMLLYARWRALLDHPTLLMQEVQRVVETPKAEQKRLKAGFFSPEKRPHPFAVFYSVWFGKDYVGAILLTNLALSILNRIDILLWIYGTFLPARALWLFGLRCLRPFEPELDAGAGVEASPSEDDGRTQGQGE